MLEHAFRVRPEPVWWDKRANVEYVRVTAHPRQWLATKDTTRRGRDATMILGIVSLYRRMPRTFEAALVCPGEYGVAIGRWGHFDP
jgi:hypothetical protein